MNARVAALVIACVTALFARVVRAHGFEPGVIELDRGPGTRVGVRWRRPTTGETADGASLRIELGPACTDLAPRRAVKVGEATGEVWDASCAPNGLESVALSAPGLLTAQTDLLVIVHDGEQSTNLVLRPGDPPLTFRAPTRAPAARFVHTAMRFVPIGFLHIARGLDHLAFVLGVVLVVRGRRALVGAITAFTVGHSITLALAVFGWLRVASPPAEASIALSVVMLAREAVLREPDTLLARRPWIASGAFGLLHGLGFASALGELGLSRDAIPGALLGFNLGVELGQLAFVACVLVGSLAIKPPRARDTARTALGYALGIAGAFWFLERTFAIGNA